MMTSRERRAIFGNSTKDAEQVSDPNGDRSVVDVCMLFGSCESIQRALSSPWDRPALVFIQCFRKLIDGVNPFHDRGLNSFLDLLVRRIFRVLMRSGNAVTTTLLDAVAQYC
jgi:hypothetical protein